MFAMKLTLIVLGALLYLIGTAVGFAVGLPALLSSGEVLDIIGAFPGTVAWLMLTIAFAIWCVIQYVKSARPTSTK